MERKMIGLGHEHKVFESKRPNLVLKTPTLLNQLQFLLLNLDPSIIRSEHQETEEMVKDKPVQIPKYRVFTLKNWKRNNFKKKPWRIFLYRGKGYVTVQEKIKHQEPNFDVANFLKDNDLPYLSHRYKSHPDNFMISKENIIYYIDPTKSIFLAGILDRLGIIPKTKYTEIKSKIFKIIPGLANHY